MDYRYMIYNNMKKCFQFSICETTEKGARKCLFNKIGNDSNKYRFEIRKVQLTEAKKILLDIKLQHKTEQIHNLIPNIDYDTIYTLVKLNYGKEKLEV